MSTTYMTGTHGNGNRRIPYCIIRRRGWIFKQQHLLTRSGNWVRDDEFRRRYLATAYTTIEANDVVAWLRSGWHSVHTGPHDLCNFVDVIGPGLIWLRGSS